MNHRKIVTGLFLTSGFTGIVYEVVWIRQFALGFGSTALALSTVVAVYLAGLAIGAMLAGRLNVKSHSLRFYGIAELLTGLYALAIPSLIELTIPWLGSIYSAGGNIAFVRALFCVVILAPATILMGATLPLLSTWVSRHDRDANRGVALLYATNLVGAAAGALISGFILLPGLGFTRTLQFVCALNVVIGIVAILKDSDEGAMEAPLPLKKQGREQKSSKVLQIHELAWPIVVFGSGFTFLLYEVLWSRISGLLFGPTASTVTLVLGTFLAGLAISAGMALKIKKSFDTWLAAVQVASIVFLIWAYFVTGIAPQIFADWVASHSDSPGQVELIKLALLAVTVTPLAAASGLIFPLVLRIVPRPGDGFARRIGGLYGINTLGCIAGSLITGWILIPKIGTAATVLVGGVLSALLALLLVRNVRPAWTARATAAVVGTVLVAAFFLPRWNMSEMTSGGYKYAEYTSDQSVLGRGELAYLKEGVSGTVAVRKSGGSTILSIDGKVDATDTGGDLLTEKLLAHIPLLLSQKHDAICLIGLASGVTAGAALTYPIQSLDVLEVSPEVVEASHFFDAANGMPLADKRTRLLVNDGRNHLLLSSKRYDVIVSEPSNPWIAGMNNLFTQDFFRIAKAKLEPGGLFAQWFHIYNMPSDDLRSLLRAFSDVFPSAALWRLNDGDVLLTGFANEAAWPAEGTKIPDAAVTDLHGAGMHDVSFLWNLYVMRDADLARFAGTAAPNTDDRPWLEFHGQRDLHAQTDMRNADDLDGFQRAVPDPPLIAASREVATEQRYLAHASTFEKAESYRSAYRNYEAAYHMNPRSMEALAGMDRNARQTPERKAVALALGLPGADSLQNRTEWALQQARGGNVAKAQFLFAENAAAYPNDPSARFNFGVFTMEQNDFRGALQLFEQTIALDPRNLPAHEAIAEVHLKLHQYPEAAKWSRRILELDPNHPTARQILAAIEREARN